MHALEVLNHLCQFNEQFGAWHVSKSGIRSPLETVYISYHQPGPFQKLCYCVLVDGNLTCSMTRGIIYLT